MPAADRLAKEIFEKARDLAERDPTPEHYELAKMAASQMYGFQLGLAFMARGASGIRARQLLDEYEATVSAWGRPPSAHI